MNMIGVLTPTASLQSTTETSSAPTNADEVEDSLFGEAADNAREANTMMREVKKNSKPNHHCLLLSLKQAQLITTIQYDLIVRINIQGNVKDNNRIRLTSTQDYFQLTGSGITKKI